MSDFLVQAWVPNLPNETVGGWRDVAVVRDLKADEGAKAAEEAGVVGRHRVSRWDTTEEYDGQPGPVQIESRTKEPEVKA